MKTDPAYVVGPETTWTIGPADPHALELVEALCTRMGATDVLPLLHQRWEDPPTGEGGAR